MGLEPTRAKRSQEPESCSSANSDTSAYVSFNSQNVFYMVIHEKSSESLKSFRDKNGFIGELMIERICTFHYTEDKQSVKEKYMEFARGGRLCMM